MAQHRARRTAQQQKATRQRITLILIVVGVTAVVNLVTAGLGPLLRDGMGQWIAHNLYGIFATVGFVGTVIAVAVDLWRRGSEPGKLTILVIVPLATLLAPIVLLWLIGSPRSVSDPRPTGTATQVATPTPTYAPSPTPIVATILAPRSGEQVANDYTARGVVPPVPAGQTVWLVVRYERGYFPQERLSPAPGGAWLDTATFGKPGDASGTQFTLLLVQTDQQADSQFADWLSRSAAAGSYQPLTQGVNYPDSHVVPLASVDVVRL